MTPVLTVTPAGAAEAYARVAGGGGSGPEFGAVLSEALSTIVETGREADTQATKAIRGEGNFTEVATAVSRAELSLQAAVAIRDKIVGAYQEVMRMTI